MPAGRQKMVFGRVAPKWNEPSEHHAQLLEPVRQLLPIGIGDANLVSGDRHAGCKLPLQTLSNNPFANTFGNQ
jgi:hypothetical protein